MKILLAIVLHAIPAMLFSQWYATDKIYNQDFAFIENLNCFGDTIIICDNEKFVVCVPENPKVFFHGEIPNYQHSKIRAIEKFDNKIYFGSSHGLFVYDFLNNTWESINTKNSNLPSDKINNLTAGNGRMYINSLYVGICYMQDGEINKIPIADDGLVPNHFLKETLINNDFYFISIDGSFVKFDGINPNYIFKAEVLSEIYNIPQTSRITGFTAHKGKIYIGTPNNQIFTYDGNELYKEEWINREFGNLDSLKLSSFEFDKNGNIVLKMFSENSGYDYLATLSKNDINLYNYRSELELERNGHSLNKNSNGDLYFFNNTKFISNGNPALKIEILPDLFLDKIYPNPAIDNLNIEIVTTTKGAKNIDIRIYNILGDEIISEKPEVVSYANGGNALLNLDISKLTKGLYILTVSTSQVTKSFKLIKK